MRSCFVLHSLRFEDCPDHTTVSRTCKRSFSICKRHLACIMQGVFAKRKNSNIQKVLTIVDAEELGQFHHLVVPDSINPGQMGG